MSWRGWLALIFAAWLIIAVLIPPIVSSQGANLANFFIVGIVFAIVGIFMMGGSKAAAWTLLISGIWLIIAAFIPPITGSKGGAITNGLIFGILGLVFSFFDRK